MIADSLINRNVLVAVCDMAEECPEGVFVEFGVYRGGSAIELIKVAEEQKRELHLFDTFTGIPYREEFDNHSIGDFSDTNEEEVRNMLPGAIFHVGIFPETMPKEFPKIAFLHIDADQYKSYITAIENFAPYMNEGGIMWFDDVGLLRGADKAIQEKFNWELTQHKCGKYFKRF
jgi:hypothetical protein